MRILSVCLVILMSNLASAGGGSFKCVTSPGKKDFDGVYIFGQVDENGLATYIVANYAEAPPIERPLVLTKFNISDDSLTFEAFDPLNKWAINVHDYNVDDNERVIEFIVPNKTSKRKGGCEIIFIPKIIN